MTFDIKQIPFSRKGSYFVISRDRANSLLFIRDIHGGDEAPSNLYEICFPDLMLEDLEITGEPDMLRIKEKEGHGRACFSIGSENTLHILLNHICMELRAAGAGYDSLISLGENEWEHILYSKDRRIRCTCVYGTMEVLGTWEITKSKDAGYRADSLKGETYFVLANYRTVQMPMEYKEFYEVACESGKEYEDFKSNMLRNISCYKNQAELAVYLLWVNFVKAEGILPYDALYCSKNWMNNIWSWDNCFMAIVLAEQYPIESYEQLRIFFHLQDESGCYPDYVNDRFASYSCCKPPIHAWAYEKMRRQNVFFEQRDICEEAYESFCRVKDYFLNYRRRDGKGLPYYQHGNDSGWDNASIFHGGLPVQSPDLPAYLIRQLDILVSMAVMLGKEEEARTLQEEADRLFHDLMEHHFDGRNFYGVHLPTGSRITDGDSLLLYMPVLIGYRMDKEILRQLVQQLEERFEGEFGLCTEQCKSPFYRKGGYWLGPIWAPVTYLIIDALRENGYNSLAKRLAVKYCKATAIGLMSENYDPFTGEGYDDPAFSWSSAVLLQLLKEYPGMEEEAG